MVFFQREAPVIREVDVCVIGGGPAGTAAAVTAARHGAKVFLAENNGMFGGLGTAGGVPVFMPFGDSEHFYAGGFGRELLDRLNKLGQFGASQSHPCINTENLKRVYDEIVTESGAEAFFFTRFLGCTAADGRIREAIFAGKRGLFAISAKIFIDATGEAAVSADLQLPTEIGDDNGKTMPGTLCMHYAGIDWNRADPFAGEARSKLPAAFADGIFRCNDPHHTGINQTGKHLGGGNRGHIFNLDPLSEASLTAGMIEGRKQSVEFERFYRDYVPGFADIELSWTAPVLGVRASRRAVTDYRMTLEDYNLRRTFSDDIGRFHYPVDIHPSSTDPKAQEHFRKLWKELAYRPGESYGISYRALVVKDVENLLVAGRCIGADHYFQSSVRTMPGCYITGQAAGLAAALAKTTGKSRDVKITELQHSLRAMGAYLP